MSLHCKEKDVSSVALDGFSFWWEWNTNSQNAAYFSLPAQPGTPNRSIYLFLYSPVLNRCPFHSYQYDGLPLATDCAGLTLGWKHRWEPVPLEVSLSPHICPNLQFVGGKVGDQDKEGVRSPSPHVGLAEAALIQLLPTVVDTQFSRHLAGPPSSVALLSQRMSKMPSSNPTPSLGQVWVLLLTQPDWSSPTGAPLPQHGPDCTEYPGQRWRKVTSELINTSPVNL